MKKAVALVLCMALMAAVFAVNAGALTEETSTEAGVPVTAEKMKVNHYEDAFTRFLPNREQGYTYDELYYHSNKNGFEDWVLVQVTPEYPVAGNYYGIFDEIVLYNAEYDPFDFGFGVYDIRQHAFYSITKAWNMDYEGLHDVFVHLVKGQGNTDLLGDADTDGELTIIDVTYIQRNLAGMMDLDECSWRFEHFDSSFGTRLTTLADYDADGECDIIDATKIQRELAGISIYPHDYTMSAELQKVGDTVQAAVSSSFGDKPVQYRYTITCNFHGKSEYNWDDFGVFEIEESWPGTFWLTTGNINSDRVEIPVRSLTYNDYFTLTVTAMDARGEEMQSYELTFRNIY